MSNSFEKEDPKISKALEKIKKFYAKNVMQITDEFKLQDYKNNSKQSPEQYIGIALLEAEKIWLNVQVMILGRYNIYIGLSDDQKINLIKSEFNEFYNEFPIVSRYMICMGQYKMKAFRRFLEKCRRALENIPAKRAEGYMENQWIERQADYVKYLWEEYQGNRHYNRHEANTIWNSAYENLKKEFSDFRNKHSETEINVKKEREKHNAELIKELAARIINGEQTLDKKETKELVEKLRDRLFKQRADNLIKQIQNDVKFIEPVLVGKGKNKDAIEEYDYEMKQFELKKKFLKPKLY